MEVTSMAGKQENGKAVAVKKQPPMPSGWPEEMDRWFDRAFRGSWPMMPRPYWARWPRMWAATAWVPEVDVIEKDDKILVKADVPGIKREDMEVAVEDGALVIKGRREESKEVKEENYRRSEQMAGEFYRSIALPEGVDPDAIEATLKDGVLEVVVPRPAQPKAKAHKVKVS
jgi:HSP20 family protein